VQGQSFFQEITTEAGIGHPGFNVGAAVGDFNRDGLDDIFVSNTSGTDLLYKNNGDNTFTEMAAEAGVASEGNSTTAVWGDLDNDGWLDLYVCARENPNLLYRNNGDGTFTEMGAQAGVNALFNPRSVNMVDYNQDGLLDIHIANLGVENILYKNLGNFRFANDVAQAGVRDRQVAMGTVFFDYDKDGDMDLYLTHDAYQANIFYRNDGDGTFTDVTAESKTGLKISSMGVDVGDINQDGWLDLHVTNMGQNKTLLNNQDGTFTNVSSPSGLGDVGMGWGFVFLDFDNDSYIDAYTANDSYFAPVPNALFRHNGVDSFLHIAREHPISNMFGSYAVASLDINDDGLLDLFVTNIVRTGNQLFLNTTPKPGNWLKIKAQGTTSNRSAIGTRFELEAGDRVFYDEINAGSGYNAMNSLTLHVGLGEIEKIDKMTVFWPSGETQIFTDISANQTLQLIEGQELPSETDSLPDLEVKIAPNPIVGIGTMQLTVAEAQQIEILLFNLKGTLVKRMHDAPLEAGRHIFELDGKQLNAGMYYLKITSEVMGESWQKVSVR